MMKTTHIHGTRAWVYCGCVHRTRLYCALRIWHRQWSPKAHAQTQGGRVKVASLRVVESIGSPWGRGIIAWDLVWEVGERECARV